jgi:hypothetical protein
VAQEDPLVVMKTGSTDFRVYSPHDPFAGFMVSVVSGVPTCTCPAFSEQSAETCPHIQAVERTVPTYAKKDARLSLVSPPSPASTPEPLPGASLPVENARYLTLKRSVSPDGRIDSLSVEVTPPIDDLSGANVRDVARGSLSLLAGIVDTFLGKNGKEKEAAAIPAAPPTPRPIPPPPDSNGVLPARIVGVGSSKTRWGWSLYLDFEVRGRSIWYFGDRGKLVGALRDAGYPDSALVRDGQKLDLPCKVVVFQDGRYTRVSRVLPAQSH